VKSVKIALWSSLFALWPFFYCVRSKRQRNLALTGPNTINTNTPAARPFRGHHHYGDSSYVRLKETLNIAVKVMKDSTFQNRRQCRPVFCSVTERSLFQKDTLFTDSNGPVLTGLFLRQRQIDR